MIDSRWVSTQMINLANVVVDERVVRLLVPVFRKEGVRGVVLLRNKRSPIDRYRPFSNAEIVFAAIQSGIDSVPAMIADWPDNVSELLPVDVLITPKSSTVELSRPQQPIHPRDMKPLERAAYFRKQIEIDGSQQKTADRQHVSRSFINNSVSLLTLEEPIKRALRDERILETAARTMALCPKELQVDLLDWYLTAKPSPSIRDLEQAVRSIQAGEGDFKAGRMLLNRFAREMGESLGCEVNLVPTGRGGWCRIYTAHADEEQISHFVRVTEHRHQLNVRPHGHGVCISFKYTDPEDLDRILPNQTAHSVVEMAGR